MKEKARWNFALCAELFFSSLAAKLALEARCQFLLIPKIGKRRVRAAIHAYTPAFRIELATALTAAHCQQLYHEMGGDLQDTSTSDQRKEQPMRPLPNARQEAFAHLVAAGHSATAAYARAYGRDRDVTSRVNGNRLLTKTNIRDRIAQIRHEAALASFPMLRQVIKQAEWRSVERIRRGSFKQAFEAAGRFAEMVIGLLG